ncbi:MULTISPECIES: isoprenylcysteine carboxylmethyltransferase family protein [unclassified Mesorhizobium]|uniref:methyltransferase family protein n=1 Tax=unclassified Mesorhizobium TaxID=325217 RepID=UPI0003CED1F0|nr:MULTISPECIES: isoprenylcysteine carboxylmethyltransferase family protein [unclassified Mesorhizobium]ESX16170.1 isoprenylcysteine carboxyl methyltransferase [Mesorhizobium sp. LSJC255A00]ESX29673.1 isoprenylcysteine carboxyl methyltransferase [Mesorhizobium sp. LSHC440B00]ESX35403.1 isoprenylcysteine carboxyl methyltransferase [Mesorhizobium sp. LSHC432A00]ESX41615.1 isoprenylcysteine carboxyl methyltransferase [Mesorhizobium sp. LSHC440A00]ESX75960.1 isoprenylcysteine carboxyl methyltransf
MTDKLTKPGLAKPDLPRRRLIPWPPLIYIAAIAISIALGLFYPLPWIGDLLGDLLFAAGFVVLFAVAALWFTAIRTMIRAKTTMNPNGVPDHLVTSGPFGVTRNPMYLANTLLLIGVAFVSGIVWFLPLALIAAFATQKVAIESEEKVLFAKFGKKYRDYTKRVRRWI